MTLLAKHDLSALLSQRGGAVPRYTSYPTAPHFAAGLGPEMQEALVGALEPGEPVSIYLHIPFCDRLCWFCGCNTKHTLKYEPVRAYVDALVAEIGAFGERAGFVPVAGQVHFGGGSPSILDSADMGRLGDGLRAAFRFTSQTEVSVEIDPSDVGEDTLAGLAALGVTRASVGVQDFDPLVQRAINRPQTFEQTRDVIEAMRAAGVGSVNIDALYGLPLQTRTRLMSTIDKVVSLDPDRIALFGYAHVPWVKKHQKMIKDEQLPDMSERFEQAVLAGETLEAAGYDPIGIDHFAKPADRLASAARTGHLRRNFQGYTTDQCKVLIPFGASSIGAFEGGYVQNIVATGQYQEAVHAGRGTALKGYRMSDDDRVRAHMIERLMCDFRISFADLEARFGEAADGYIDEACAIADAETHDLCGVDIDGFFVPEQARPFARIVASRFDAHLNDSNFRYSKAV
ncbi:MULTISPECIES: oxygen-independent coproporphyrinogen III oxidase [unclassified Roseitalea]|uniref:oxygen-independent coproporphyrinogen III oxidase n=1 Tax=unclassified Roseitalea TaxID=2639107 RepID=UPI00273FB6B8|nr:MULTISPECIES: oxygen-independent coproporphyrinogen III oxidase [unclassified Roseitalea]